jgi:hypothetical protein
MKPKLKRAWFPVCIRYDNESFADGFGAQALRLVGIFSISQRYRLRYEHRSLRFDHPDELLGPHSSRENYLEVMKQIDKLLYLPNIGHSRRKKKIIINLRSITRRKLLTIIFRSLLSHSEFIINLQLPQGITDYRPEILELGASSIRDNLEQLTKDLSLAAIVVHIRTGNRTIKTSRFNSLPQLTPHYYKYVLKPLMASKPNLIIHSDLFPEDFLQKAPTVRFQLFKEFFDDYSKSPVTSIFHYAPILKVVSDMSTAKVLIMSNSALSYFAGLLNTNTVIWPPIHGHAKLKRWLKGPELTPQTISFVDNTDFSRQESVDHSIYKDIFRESQD